MDDFIDGAVDKFGRVINNLAFDALWQLRLNAGKNIPHSAYHFQQVGAGRNLKSDINGLVAVEGNAGFVIVRAQRDFRNILEPDNRAVLLFDNQIFKFSDRMQAGRCRQVDLYGLAFGGA